MTIRLTVNGIAHDLDVPEDAPLIYVLRNDLALHGPKLGCGLEQCGACLVLADGDPVYACSALVRDVAGRSIETVEGLLDEYGELHPIQEAFLSANAAQCGFCLSGVLVRTRQLLTSNPNPSRSEICKALDDHLCRCGAQPRMINAVESAAARLREKS
jgi:nicotinate dehydrogenase subunit A